MLSGRDFCHFCGNYDNSKCKSNLKALLFTFAQNRQFMKICVNANKNERRERKNGFFERLKICTRPPEPPPRPPNIIERILKRVHTEGVIAAREIISASFASILSISASQPFDVLKHKYVVKPFNGGPWYRVLSRQYRLIHEIRSIVATKGYARFYRGHLEAQRQSLFQTISMFYTYQRVYQELENFENQFKAYPDLCTFFSGFVSASISVLFLRPYANFHNQMANKRILMQKFGPICAAYTLRQKQKWYNVFKGCFSDFMYTGTQYGLRFLFYNKISEEILKRKPENIRVLEEYFRSNDSASSELEPVRPIKVLTSSEALFAGAASGILSDLATHPMDVINARLKMHALARQASRYDGTCRKYGQCFRLIWKQKKLKGFYPGFVPMLLKSSISTAVTFAVYDAVQQWLQVYLLTG